ncbi:hypothetical protein C0J52_12509 [Blattella germanica]|nr:hypothetical protein C0J52_12509 [Blattella germanica]
MGLQRRHKVRGHLVKEQHIRDRFTNARKLYEHHLAGEKWQRVVSLDEAWVYLDDRQIPAPFSIVQCFERCSCIVMDGAPSTREDKRLLDLIRKAGISFPMFHVPCSIHQEVLYGKQIAVMTDLTQYLNDLTQRLQGKTQACKLPFFLQHGV